MSKGLQLLQVKAIFMTFPELNLNLLSDIITHPLRVTFWDFV